MTTQPNPNVPMWNPWTQRYEYPRIYPVQHQYMYQHQAPVVIKARFPHIPWLIATLFTAGIAGFWYLKAYVRFRMAPNRAVTR